MCRHIVNALKIPNSELDHKIIYRRLTICREGSNDKDSNNNNNNSMSENREASLRELCRMFEAVSSARPTVSKDHEDRCKSSVRDDIATGKREGFRSKQPTVTCTVHGTTIPTSWDQVRQPRPVSEGAGGPFEITIDKYPFSMGGVRAAYRGILADGRGNNKNVVLKEMIVPEVRSEVNYTKQSEASAVSAFLAQKFSEESGYDIKVLPSRIVKIRRDGRDILLNCEDDLGSVADWKKWTTNWGTKNPEGVPKELERFSRWTHEKTRGYLLVADLQGSKTSSGGYILTDPGVNCTDKKRFGSTNLGEVGIQRCLEALTGKGRTALLDLVESSIPSTYSFHAPGFSATDSEIIRGISSIVLSDVEHNGSTIQRIEPGCVDMGSGFGSVICEYWTCCGKSREAKDGCDRGTAKAARRLQGIASGGISYTGIFGLY